MNAQDDLPRQGRKLTQVVEGARTVFLRDGFEGAGVDDIAREAGVSKATLYSYFPDKRFLFVEVAKIECRRQADAALATLNFNRPPREVLAEAATRMTRFFLSDFGQAIYRICVAESARFPELGKEFYASGPQVARDILADYLKAAMARGELDIPDVALAADQFPELCKASLHLPLVLGLKESFSEAEVENVITGAVDMFLARYGTQPKA